MDQEESNSIVPEVLAGAVAYKVIDGGKNTREMFSKLPGSGALRNQLARSSVNIKREEQSVASSVLSQIMALEEASPLHILRTFQLTNLLQPFVKVTDFNQEVHISGQALRGQQAFYEALIDQHDKEIKRKVKRLLRAEDLKRGFIFKNNKLYGMHSDGTMNASDVVLQDARLVLASQKNGQIVSQNHILRKYAEGLGTTLDYRQTVNTPLMVIGGAKNTLGKQLNSYLKLGMEIGYKTLDNPIAGFEEIVGGLGGNITGLTSTNSWQKFKGFANIQLGTGGVYNLGHADSLKRLTKNLGTKSLAAYLGYQVLDSAARTVAEPGSAFDSGLFAGLGGMYADARIGFAKIWSDRFQNYRNNQEHSAAGSTDLLTLAGMPLGAALIGAQSGYFGRIGNTFKNDAATAANIYSAEKVSPLLSKIGLKQPMTIMKRNATIGGILGAVSVLPYLPGALIGASSQELEDKYSGKKEEAVKANRWWLMGGNSIHGEHTKYFKKNWFAEALSEAKTKAIYGDAETKKSMNPLLHPFSYLRDPYKFEKMADASGQMPYPVWGMEIGFGSFIGKAYERTIGQLIKPDILNPRVQAEQRIQEKETKRLKGTDAIAGVDIDQEILDFRRKNLGKQDVPVDEDSDAPRTKSTKGKLQNSQMRNIDATTASQIKGLKEQNGKIVDLSGYEVVADDGDTVQLTKKGDKSGKTVKVRLAGIDAPEYGDHKTDNKTQRSKFHANQEYSQQAKDTLQTLLSSQKGLKLVVNTKDMAEGRYLGVFVGDGNKNLNLSMIEEGAASALPWGSTDLIRAGEVNAAQRRAVKKNAGMWSSTRYKAESYFNQLVGEEKTHNTFTAMQKLAERPELAAYASFLKNLEGHTEELTQEQQKTLQRLAQASLDANEAFMVKTKALEQVGMTLNQSLPSFQKTGAINTKLNFALETDRKDKEAIDTGFLNPYGQPAYTPLNQNLQLAYQSITDFVGIKGWAFGLAAEAIIGATPDTSKELAKSGESSNFARAFKNLNLGDVAGIGEFQRKILGTSSGAIQDTTNNMKNKAPSWLPSDLSQYFVDFSKGNFYDTVENGAVRLPGKGYEAYNQDLKGLDPEMYPLIHQYKILSDVAKGSREQYAMRRKMLDLYKDNKLSKRETDLLVETLDKEVAREQKKSFRDDSIKTNGLIGFMQGALWENLVGVSNSNPLEMLTPWRPFSKFMHQRTAIEDYKATQLGGSDTAIWTKPYDHFIKPAFNKIGLLANSDFKPKEAIERDNINEYFDKLQFVKAKLNGDKRGYEKTVVMSSLLGLNTKEKVLNFKAALSDDQKLYFDSFSKETNKGKRSEILKMLPNDLARGYEQIWRNLDIAEGTKKTGGSIQKAIANEYLKSTESLKRAVGGVDMQLTDNDKNVARERVDNNRDYYSQLGFSTKERRKLAEADIIRERVAQKEATTYIEGRTSNVNGYFAGWDPRLTIKDIKIKTLAIGKEDLRRFGFWKGDEERMNRIQALDNDSQVTTEIDLIKKEIASERDTKRAIDNALFRKGFKSSKIKINNSEMNSILIRNNDRE